MAANLDKEIVINSGNFSLEETKNDNFGAKIFFPFKKLYRLAVQNLGGFMNTFTVVKRIFSSSESVGSVSAVTVKETSPYDDLGEVVCWLDLTEYPTKELLEEKFICLEYSRDKFNSLIEWLERVQEFVIENDVEFDSILVFANYNKLDAVEVTKLVSEFDSVGALFTKFPRGCETFRDAVEEYNRRIGKVRINNNKYDTERKRLLESNVGVNT